MPLTTHGFAKCVRASVCRQRKLKDCVMPAALSSLDANPLEHAPIGRRQRAVLIATLIASILDGYDALAMAFVAPELSRLWHIEKAMLGLLLSASLGGMAVGALLI